MLQGTVIAVGWVLENLDVIAVAFVSITLVIVAWAPWERESRATYD